MQKCKLCDNPAIVSLYTGTQYCYCNVCMEKVKELKRRATNKPIESYYQCPPKWATSFYIKLQSYFDDKEYYWGLFGGVTLQTSTNKSIGNTFLWDKINKVPREAFKSSRVAFITLMGMTAPQAFVSFPMGTEYPEDIFVFTRARERLQKTLGVSPLQKGYIGFCERCGAPTCVKSSWKNVHTFWSICLRCKPK